MNRRTFLFFCALMLLSVTCITAQTDRDLQLEPGVKASAKIDNIYGRFSEAYRKLDPELVAGLYSTDAFYLPPSGEPTRGRDKILADFSRFFGSVKSSGSSIEISFQILRREVADRLAYDVGIYTLRTRSANGSRASRGKFTVVMRKLEDGNWIFVVDSYSDMPPANSNQ